MLHASRRIHGRDARWALEAAHVTTLPLVTAWTWSCMTVSADGMSSCTGMRGTEPGKQVVVGMALGVSAFLTVVGAAYSRGWVQFPHWGWEITSKRHVAYTFLLQSIGHGAIAWNEELVFRGYGLHIATTAVGRPAAILGLTTLFALGHGPKPRVVGSQLVAGLTLTGLRLSSDSLWLPIGYHFAWNFVQTAILGPSDGLPSLRPMYCHGPELWLGRPGHPEPGLLATIVELTIAMASALVWWRRHRL